MAQASALEKVLSENIGREGVNDAFDKLDRIFEGFNNRVTFKNLALAERYLKKEMRLCVVFRFVEDPSRQFVAVFQREFGHTRARPWRKWFELSGERELDAHEVGGDGHNRSVFVYVVDAPESEQVVSPASFVRFDVAHDFLGLRADTPKEIREFASGKSWLPTYREVGVSHYALGKRQRLDAAHLHQRKCEGIERGNGIVRDVSDIGAKLGRHALPDAKSVDLDGGFRLLICNDRIWIATTEIFDSLFEVSKVFVGAVDLNSTTPERINGHGKGLQGAGGNESPNGRSIASAA